MPHSPTCFKPSRRCSPDSPRPAVTRWPACCGSCSPRSTPADLLGVLGHGQPLLLQPFLLRLDLAQLRAKLDQRRVVARARRELLGQLLLPHPEAVDLPLQPLQLFLCNTTIPRYPRPTTSPPIRGQCRHAPRSLTSPPSLQ